MSAFFANNNLTTSKFPCLTALYKGDTRYWDSSLLQTAHSLTLVFNWLNRVLMVGKLFCAIASYKGGYSFCITSLHVLLVNSGHFALDRTTFLNVKLAALQLKH